MARKVIMDKKLLHMFTAEIHVEDVGRYLDVISGGIEEIRDEMVSQIFHYLHSPKEAV